MPKKFYAKIMGVGEGSSAFYPEDVVREDGVLTFVKGVRMLSTHIRANEDHDSNVQGIDLDDVIGVLDSNVEYRESYVYEGHDYGKGLYADVKLYDQTLEKWGDKIEDGLLKLSISAFFYSDPDQVHETKDGRQLRVVKSFYKDITTVTVDGLAYAGLEGSGVIHAQESMRLVKPASAHTSGEASTKENSMTLEELQAELADANDKISTLTETVKTLTEQRDSANKLVRKSAETKAMDNLFQGVEFVDPEAKEYAFEKARSAMVWDAEGNLNEEELLGLTEKYRSGESGLVKTAKKDEAPKKEGDLIDELARLTETYNVPTFNVPTFGSATEQDKLPTGSDSLLDDLDALLA